MPQYRVHLDVTRCSNENERALGGTTKRQSRVRTLTCYHVYRGLDERGHSQGRVCAGA